MQSKLQQAQVGGRGGPNVDHNFYNTIKIV